MLNNIGLPGLILLLGVTTGAPFVSAGVAALQVASPVPYPGANTGTLTRMIASATMED